MEAADARRAVTAAMSVAESFDLAVDDAVVLNDSNRLVVRLMPCDVVARVVPLGYRVFAAAVGAGRDGRGAEIARHASRVTLRLA